MGWEREIETYGFLKKEEGKCRFSVSSKGNGPYYDFPFHSWFRV